MKNLQKGSVTIWIVTFVVLVIIGGVFYFKGNRSQENSSLSKIENPSFEVSYSAKIFSEVPTHSSLPTDYKISYSGVKLLDPKYLSRIGKKECSSGEISDVMRTCTAENQPGLSFIVLERTLDDTTSLFMNVGTSNQTIGGKKFVTSIIAAEGSGLAYYFYPIRADKTLIIIRSIVENDTLIPDEDIFDQIVSSLTIK
jgi:hypothetical protein